MNTFGARLKYARKLKGLTQGGLAKLMGNGLTHASISDWERDKYQPDGVNSRLLESALNRDFDWLKTGDEKKLMPKGVDLSPVRDTIMSYPLISWVDVKLWSSDNMDSSIKPLGAIESSLSVGSNSFWLEVESENMAPVFSKGDRVLIDLNRSPKHEDYALCCLKKNGHTLRQVVIDGGQIFVKSINPDWPNKLQPIGDECKIKGMIVEKSRRFI